MVTLKFEDEQLIRAVESLKEAIGSIGTDRFDFSYQLENKTITVSEKNIEIVTGYLRKDGITDFEIDRGYGII